MIHDSSSFSPEAQQRWDNVSDSVKQKIRANVWCVACRQPMTMINMTGTAEETTLVLRGHCGSCGHTVARVLEDHQ